MQISQTLTYPTSPQNLVEILTNPDFISWRLGMFDLCPQITLDHPGGAEAPETARTVRTTVEVPASLLPTQARSFLPEALPCELVETFTPTAPHTWEVRTILTVGSLPVSAEATSTLSADGAHTQRELQGQISVNIPFFGRKVESLLARYVTDAAQAEVDSVRQWIVR